LEELVLPPRATAGSNFSPGATLYSEEVLDVAKSIFWFGSPEEALEFPRRFPTYAMTYASGQEIAILRKYVRDGDFQAAFFSISRAASSNAETHLRLVAILANIKFRLLFASYKKRCSSN